MTFELDPNITLRKLLEQHPEWADLPIGVYSTNGGGECTWPLVYSIVPDEGEEGFGNLAYNRLIFSNGD